MRGSRWGYAAVSGLHVLGIGLLLGAILPLNLRLVGAFPSLALPTLARLLVPAAILGLTLTVTMGLLLFLARTVHYGGLTIFWVKMGLVCLGTLHALALHAAPGLLRASPARLRAAGIVSALCWLAALACGRAIAFVV